MAVPLVQRLRRRPRILKTARARLGGRRALEVGGPSRLFTRRGRLPVYPGLTSLDLLDFGEGTIWRREDRAPPDLPPGRRLRGEASDLAFVEPGAYEALLASHVVEHLADPLRALEEFRRVLAPPGWLLLVLPHPAGTFDHRRPVTTLEHLVEDRRRGVGEDDETHVEEILRLHDLSRDPGAGDRAQFERRARENRRFRSLHHHVFDPSLAVAALAHVGFGVEELEVVRPYHIVLLARADGEGRAAHERLLAPDAPWRRRSPFSGDRTPA